MTPRLPLPPAATRPRLRVVAIGALCCGLTAIAPFAARAAEADIHLRRQAVQALPGALDAVPMINDNNPELIREPGILLSTFDGDRFEQGAAAHLDAPLSGRFDLFSHHVYAGEPDRLDSTLWLAVVAAPVGDRPVTLRLLEGATSLSQATRPDQVAAPFLPMPAVMAETSSPIFAGPGSRVAGELLRGEATASFPDAWTLPPGAPTTLLTLPIPVEGLDPLLNGRNLQLRLHSDGPVAVATLASYGRPDRAPDERIWREMLAKGRLSPREHQPTPRGASGRIIYSRVSGIQLGTRWQGRLTSEGRNELLAREAPVSWPISSLERGSLGTGQVQTAELSHLYPGTAWAAHGNYGVEYDLTLPLYNDGPRPLALNLAVESPLKTDEPLGGLRFRRPPAGSVMFRGPIEVRGLDGPDCRPSGPRGFHLVARQGMEGPALGRISLAPGERRTVRVRLIYPADATPPQVLSLLPVKQSPSSRESCR
jgi:hypothetical protein